jgi:hypothetical protein
MTYNIELTKEQQESIEFITNEEGLEAVVFHQVMAKEHFERLVEFARSLGLAKKEADLQETVIEALHCAGFIGVEKHLKGWAIRRHC